MIENTVAKYNGEIVVIHNAFLGEYYYIKYSDMLDLNDKYSGSIPISKFLGARKHLTHRGCYLPFEGLSYDEYCSYPPVKFINNSTDKDILNLIFAKAKLVYEFEE